LTENEQQNRFQQYLNGEKDQEQSFTTSEKSLIVSDLTDGKNQNTFGRFDFQLAVTTAQNINYCTADSDFLYGFGSKTHDMNDSESDEDETNRTSIDRTLFLNYDADKRKEGVEYSPLFELHLKVVDLSSCILIIKIQQKQQEPPAFATAIAKTQKFTIQFSKDLNLEPIRLRYKLERLNEKIKEIFSDKKLDSNDYALIDSEQIIVDFLSTITKQVSCDYQIIEKSSLLNVNFYYLTKNEQFQYTAKHETDIFTIVSRLIDDEKIRETSFCLIDQLGQIVDGGSICDIYRTDTTVHISIIDETINNLCQVTVISKQG
ncbi:unnamed protein product, partial [Didymodactylos carnosus]